jgi:hypothetical protein
VRLSEVPRLDHQDRRLAPGPGRSAGNLKDRSSQPHHSPQLTQAEVIEKVVCLRKHFHFGPAKIATYLARYHDLTIKHLRGVAHLEAARDEPAHLAALPVTHPAVNAMSSNAPAISCRST